MKQMYHPSDLAAMDPLVLMKNLDHVRMTSRRLSYVLQQQVQTSLRSVSVMDPASEISRFEERVRRQEAQVRGMEEVAASSLEEQFASLETADDELEVEARLAALKSGR